MHVVLITPAWPLGFPNGIVTYVHHLRCGLQAAGHSVSVLVLLIHRGQSEEGVSLLRSDWRSRLAQWSGRQARRLGLQMASADDTPSQIARALHRLHRENPIDLVEMEESFGWFAEVQARVPFPVVVKLHGPAFLSLVEAEATEPGGLLRIDAEGRALHGARYLTSPSQDTLERTRVRYALGNEVGWTVPNPIVMPPDCPRWQADKADWQTLLFVGRFDERKGGDLVIRCFERLLRTRPALTLVFVGPDPGVNDGEHGLTHLPEFLQRHLSPAAQRQVVVRGPLDPAAITLLRCEAAVTLVCSRWDNQPNTALEALLQACPVAGFDAGGLSEIVQSGVSGLLAPAGDIDALARHVETLLDQPQLAAGFGTAGLARIARIHGVTAVTERTVACYQAVRDDWSRSHGHAVDQPGKESV